MDIMTKDDLRNLLENRERPSVSLYMPTHRAGREVRQNVIRFKNLVRRVEKALGDMGLPGEGLLDPLRRLERDSLYWTKQGDGLALFLSPQLFLSYRLSIPFDPVAVVADRFHIKPLLPLLTIDGRFYVLAVGQNGVRLLECSRQKFKELRPEKMPSSLEEALKFDEPERQLQFHTGTQSAGGRRPAMFHGHGVGIDDTKDRILRYCQMVDAALHPILGGERDPLVLAGLEPVISIYRKASGYPHIEEKALEGNPEGMAPEDLHRLGWGAVVPRFEKDRREAAAKYWNLAGTGRTSCNAKEILRAAVEGRVDWLFTATDQHLWGAFDEATGQMTLHEENRPGDEDLLDCAAFWALLKGGTVHAVPQEEIPDKSEICAVFRY